MNRLLNRIRQTLVRLLGAGCEVTFVALSDLKAEDWRGLEYLRASSSPFVEGINGVVGLPIYMGDSLAGLVVINGVKDVNSAEWRLLADLLAAIVEHNSEYQDRVEDLRREEESIELVNDHTNVIPLRPRSVHLEDDYSYDLSVDESALIGLKPLLILSDDAHIVQRLGLEMHQLLRRFAFLNVEDLPADIFSSRESLKELGAITIMIRDLSSLTAEQQLKLAEYLATQPAGDMPLIIARLKPTTQTIDQAAESAPAPGHVFPHLIQQFFVSELQGQDISLSAAAADLIDSGLRERPAEDLHTVGGHVIPFHSQYFDPDHPTFH